MKNKLFLMISVIMVCSLCACGQQESGTMTNTGNSTEHVVASENNSEQTTTEDNNMEQTEMKEQNQLQDVKSSYKEFGDVLEEINAEIHPGTAGNGLISVKVAADLLNWGVETGMTTDEIKKETVSWLCNKGNSEQVELPYEGAKEMLLVEGVDSKEYLAELFKAMYDELPVHK